MTLLYAASNILHAADLPSPGVLTFLALATRELIDAGVQQTVLYAHDGDSATVARQFHPQVRLLHVQRPARRGLLHPIAKLRAALCRELSARAYDAVHLHAPSAGLIGRAILSGVRDHPPIYYSPHGLRNLSREG